MPAGVVYGAYEVIDRDIIRVTIDYNDTHLDLLVTVEFSNPDEMSWYINAGERKWWTLSRSTQ